VYPEADAVFTAVPKNLHDASYAIGQIVLVEIARINNVVQVKVSSVFIG
jgi:hypothetical protein